MAMSPSDKMPTRRLSRVDHRQTPDLNIAHVADDVLDVLVVKAVLYLLRHDIAPSVFWPCPLQRRESRYRVSDHANEPISVANRQDARAMAIAAS